MSPVRGLSRLNLDRLPRVGLLYRPVESFGTHAMPGMNSLCKLLEHLPVERRDVVGLSAGDQTFVGYDFTIYPVAAGIPNIRLK